MLIEPGKRFLDHDISFPIRKGRKVKLWDPSHVGDELYIYQSFQKKQEKKKKTVDENRYQSDTRHVKKMLAEEDATKLFSLTFGAPIPSCLASITLS